MIMGLIMCKSVYLECCLQVNLGQYFVAFGKSHQKNKLQLQSKH